MGKTGRMMLIGGGGRDSFVSSTGREGLFNETGAARYNDDEEEDVSL